MKDIVIGAITNYDWDKIKYWVNSLEASGFSGTKAMICYKIGYDVISKLTERGFTVFGFKKNDQLSRLEYQKTDFNICLERFLHIWYFLNKKIKYWVNSLESSGFSGTKAMVCYNVVSKLTERGFTVFGFKKNDQLSRLEYRKTDFNICLERFLHIWYFLNKLQNKEDYRYIISTDVKDVIFQTNPSEWLEKNIGNKKINVASESIRYQDEEWGKNNLLQSFGPLIFDSNLGNVIYNAGTISGEFNTTIDLLFNIFLSCGGAPQNVPGGGGPDQAALNVLLNMSPYKEITNFADSESGYAAQLGTTGPQVKEKYGDKLVEPSPIFEDGLVKTSTGVPFSIVHQYDRVPEWKDAIERKYS